MTETRDKARAAVEAIFADLRDRKFLKYLFADDPDSRGAYGHIDAPLDLAVQGEIADAWERIIATSIESLKDKK